MKKLFSFLAFLFLPFLGFAQVQVNVTDTRFNTSTGEIAGRTTVGPGATQELTPDQAIGIVGAGAGGFGYRDRILNGSFQVDQVNAGAAVTINNVGPGARHFIIPDQWGAWGVASAGVYTCQQASSTPPPGATNYLHVVVTTADASPAAGSIYNFSQPIEASQIQDLQYGTATAQTVTVSFQVRSSLTGSFSGSLKNSATNYSYPFSYSIPVANTWTSETITIAGPTAGTWLSGPAVIGVSVVFDMGTGATGRGTAGSWSPNNYSGVTGAVRPISTNGTTFDLTTVQFEKGSFATTFEVRPIDTEIRLCQRFLATSFVFGTAPADGLGAGLGEVYFLAGKVATTGQVSGVRFPVALCKTPLSITTYNPRIAGTAGQVADISAGADCSATSTTNLSANGFAVLATGNVSTVVGNILAVQYLANARMN